MCFMKMSKQNTNSRSSKHSATKFLHNFKSNYKRFKTAGARRPEGPQSRNEDSFGFFFDPDKGVANPNFDFKVREMVTINSGDVNRPANPLGGCICCPTNNGQDKINNKHANDVVSGSEKSDNRVIEPATQDSEQQHGEAKQQPRKDSDGSNELTVGGGEHHGKSTRWTADAGWRGYVEPGKPDVSVKIASVVDGEKLYYEYAPHYCNETCNSTNCSYWGARTADDTRPYPHNDMGWFVRALRACQGLQPVGNQPTREQVPVERSGVMSANASPIERVFVEELDVHDDSDTADESGQGHVVCDFLDTFEVRGVGGHNLLNCAKCKASFSSIKELARHARVCVRRCNVCMRVFATENQAKVHAARCPIVTLPSDSGVSPNSSGDVIITPLSTNECRALVPFGFDFVQHTQLHNSDSIKSMSRWESLFAPVGKFRRKPLAHTVAAASFFTTWLQSWFKSTKTRKFDDYTAEASSMEIPSIPLMDPKASKSGRAEFAPFKSKDLGDLTTVPYIIEDHGYMQFAYNFLENVGLRRQHLLVLGENTPDIVASDSRHSNSRVVGRSHFEWEDLYSYLMLKGSDKKKYLVAGVYDRNYHCEHLRSLAMSYLSLNDMKAHEIKRWGMQRVLYNVGRVADDYSAELLQSPCDFYNARFSRAQRMRLGQAKMLLGVSVIALLLYKRHTCARVTSHLVSRLCGSIALWMRLMRGSANPLLTHICSRFLCILNKMSVL